MVTWCPRATRPLHILEMSGKGATPVIPLISFEASNKSGEILPAMPIFICLGLVNK